jgi:SPP1 family predicted phage head-tail adaptor
MIAAGGMIHRVTIETPTRTSNVTGEVEVTTFTAVATSVPVRIAEQGSVEVYRARQVQADATHVLRMRWTTLVTQTCRIRWPRPEGDRILNVVGISNPDGKRVELVINCREQR